MLNNLLKIHKKTVLIGGNGFNVDCVLKPTPSSSGFALKGLTSFIGVTFEEGGGGYFGDSFELTIDVEDLRVLTDLIPTTAWGVSVKMPQMNNAEQSFCIENVAIDRTLGMYLLKCSATTSQGQGRRVNRQNSGGL